MSGRIPEPASAAEEDGQPDMGYVLAEKEITGDAQEGLELSPRDTPLAVDDYGTTAAEEAAGEPLDLRLSREEPDVLDRADLDADESEGADSPYPVDAEERVGRIVESDEGARSDTEAEAVGHDVGTDLGGFSAEERAMHIEPGT
ncbi:MAG: DUF5709 domain-containing protein [Actinomycetota bacterium]|nr:DUF5709 domain-containing protein [Actinomycetota bacterium]